MIVVCMALVCLLWPFYTTLRTLLLVGVMWALMYVDDSIVWVVAFEWASLLLLHYIYAWSSSGTSRIHMALLIFYSVLCTSAALLLMWLCSGAVTLFIVAMCIKLAIYPLCGWLLEIHAQLPTVGSMVLSGIFVKLGWIGLLTYAYRTSVPLLVSCSCAGTGALLLSMSLLSIYQLKRYLALMTAIHTNTFFVWWCITCG